MPGVHPLQRVVGQAGSALASAPIRRWVLLCGAAEAVGMTAAAFAAKLSANLFGEPTGGKQVAATLALVIAGGLIEGLALGVAQASGLERGRLRFPRRRYILVTVAVAGLGWAAASAPSIAGGRWHW
jgi:hypothetical protein